MLSLSGALVVLVFVGFLMVGFLPTIVAYRKKHPNRFVVGVVNAAFLFCQVPDQYKWVMALGWFLCLAFAFWKTERVTVIETRPVSSPVGQAGPRGGSGATAPVGAPGPQEDSEYVAMSPRGVIKAGKTT